MPPQFLRPAEQWHRRSIADALEVLRSELAFGSSEQAKVIVGPLSYNAYSVGLFFDGSFVLLRPARGFHAFVEGSQERHSFPVGQLYDAVVNDKAIVRTAAGTSLRAVEIIPAAPSNLSAYDWLIIHFAVEAAIAEGQQVRLWHSFREQLPSAFKITVPNILLPDFAALGAMQPVPYKVFQYYLAVHVPGLAVSRRKYEQLLAQVGLSIPLRHRRRRRATV